MNAARLAEILSEPSPRGLDEILDDPSAAAIPGLKALVPMTVVDRPLVLAALGACVMAAEDEAVPSEQQIDDYLKVVAPEQSVLADAIRDYDPTVEKPKYPIRTAADRPSFLPPNSVAPTASSLHQSAGPFGTPNEIAALTNCAKADERLLEDITTIRTDVLRELRHVAELFLALTSES